MLDELHSFEIQRDQMEVESSVTRSIFASIFFAFLESKLNLQCFEKKNEPDKSSISEVIDSNRCASLNAYQGLFLKPFSQ